MGKNDEAASPSQSSSQTCDFDAEDLAEGWWQEVQSEDKDTVETTCDREVWSHQGNTFDQCIWHAKSEDKQTGELVSAIEDEDFVCFPYLVEADFGAADFSGNVFLYGDFSGADFRDATVRHADLTRGKFNGAMFSGLDLYTVDFPGATFDKAVLNQVTCAHVNFCETSFSDAVLVQSQLQAEVNIDGAQFDGTVLTGTVAEPEVLEDFSSTYAPSDWEKASREYERLRRMAETSSLGAIRDQLYIKQKDARRQTYCLLSRKRISAGASRWLFRYGEKPIGVVAWSLVIISLYIPILAHFGGIRSDDGLVILNCESVLEYAYFSMLTFSTVGYGDYQPATLQAQLTAATEALVGAVMIALLVFSLGRRATK